MTSWEFSHWIAYYEMDPWGDERADLRNAMMCATMANIHRKKGSRRITIGDFMPRFGEKQEQDPEQMRKSFVRAMMGSGVRFVDADTGKTITREDMASG